MEVFKTEFFFDLKNCYFGDIFNDVNLVWEVLPKIKDYIKNNLDKNLLKGSYDEKKGIFIGEGTVVQEGAMIIGPAIIGKNCFIGHASLIRENCLFADNVHIGHGTEVKNSIFLNTSIAAHLNYVGDSLIGNNVNISAAVILPSFRLDKKSITINTGKEKIDTGLRKLGSIIGDDSNIGVNSVLNPGTILGKKTIVYPLLSVVGVHKNGEVIK